MTRYIVCTLDVWGHAPSECCAAYSCGCVKTDDEGEETHDEDRCDCSYDVNERHYAGTIEIPDGADDAVILAALDADDRIHADKCEVGEDHGDGSYLTIASKATHKPLLTLEATEA